jgi:hypothetical protein
MGLIEMVTWEYTVIPVKTRIHSRNLSGDKKPEMEDVQNDLNRLGEKGWELVGVQDVSLADGRRFTVAYLKRLKENE